MQADIYSNNLLIGRTIFRNSFGSMGHIFGDFTPTENYLTIKKDVQEFCSSEQKNFNKWYNLRINVKLENGYYILPAGGYEIIDHPDVIDESIEIHLAGVDSHVFQDFFVNRKAFLKPPWTTISIAEKIELEDDLHSFLDSKIRISALGHHSLNNDVLFAINGHKSASFVVVNKIQGKANYFETFEDFDES